MRRKQLIALSTHLRRSVCQAEHVILQRDATLTKAKSQGRRNLVSHGSKAKLLSNRHTLEICLCMRGFVVVATTVVAALRRIGLHRGELNAFGLWKTVVFD